MFDLLGIFNFGQNKNPYYFLKQHGFNIHFFMELINLELHRQLS